jgi:hypothetical protein
MFSSPTFLFKLFNIFTFHKAKTHCSEKKSVCQRRFRRLLDEIYDDASSALTISWKLKFWLPVFFGCNLVHLMLRILKLRILMVPREKRFFGVMSLVPIGVIWLFQFHCISKGWFFQQFCISKRTFILSKGISHTNSDSKYGNESFVQQISP